MFGNSYSVIVCTYTGPYIAIAMDAESHAPTIDQDVAAQPQEDKTIQNKATGY